MGLSLDLTVEVTKHNRFTGADEPTVVHNVRQLPGTLAGMKSGRITLGQVVEGWHGMDPHNVLNALPAVAGALDPEQRRNATPFLDSVKQACEWADKVRVLRRPAVINRLEESDGATVVADLYQNDCRIVVKKDGASLG